MMKNLIKIFSFLLPWLCLGLIQEIKGQEISVEMGDKEIAMNEHFTITVKVDNGRIKDYDQFPVIKGLKKSGTSSSSSTNIVNGQIRSSHSITQNYQPIEEGEIIIPAFTMEVNGQDISVEKTSVKVVKQTNDAANTRRPSSGNPFDQFFDRQNKEGEQFEDVDEDAFLALSTDKSEVFVGEGFTTTLAFYVSRKNKAPLQFHDLGKQLTGILKDLKPANCWEENFDIDNITGKQVNIDGEPYLQYKVYQATFFPLNLQDIQFPSVGLEMIKYKVAKNPSFFGQNREEGYKTFYSQEKTVQVKPLPQHPLKNSVAVGEFSLEESIDNKNIKTGASIGYNFKIKGAGNIAAIEKPAVKQTEAFDIYAPEVQQHISKRGNTLRGNKNFEYYLVSHEPGSYNLGEYFNWIYFDPSEERYDTLTSQIQVKVTGESRKDEHIMASDNGAFYEKIGRTNNQLQNLGSTDSAQYYLYLLMLLMLIVTGIIIFKK